MQKQRERGIKRGRETESEQESSAKMATGVRELNVLGEFKPFGLIAEGLDGKSTDNVSDKYDYFLFDPDVTRERDEFEGIDSSASSSISIDGCDHEIFIRGDR